MPRPAHRCIVGRGPSLARRSVSRSGRLRFRRELLGCARLVGYRTILRVPLGQPACKLAAWLRPAAPASRLASIDDALPEELADHSQSFKIGVVAFVDYGQQTARSVAQPKEAVHLVGEVNQLLGQYMNIDLDHAV